MTGDVHFQTTTDTLPQFFRDWTRKLARLQSSQSDCSAHCDCSPLIGWMLNEKTGTTPRRPPEHQPITTKEILLEFTSASTQTFHSCAKKIVPDKDEMFWSMTATQVTPLLEKCFPFVVRFYSPPIMLPHLDKLYTFFSDLPCESAATVLENDSVYCKNTKMNLPQVCVCVSL